MHVYGQEWTATLEEIICEYEIGNVVKRYSRSILMKQLAGNVPNCKVIVYALL